MDAGWRSSSGAEFRACTSSTKAFVFDVGGGGSDDNCSQYVRAQDQDKNQLVADFNVYDKRGSEWHLDTRGTTTGDAQGARIYLDIDTDYKF